MTAELTPEQQAALAELQRSVPTRQEQGNTDPLQFVFVWRVSTRTEAGVQDPKVSEAWQRGVAEETIKGVGSIVRTVGDDESRDVPWFRRPNAARLLEEIEFGQHHGKFNALVVGETKRMFAGSQLEDVYHVLKSGGIQLWLPGIGRYDETNMSHRLLLSFEGIIGKNESETVRKRVRDAMTGIAKNPHDRRWLGGSPPFGYVLHPLEGAAKTSGKGYTNTLAINEEQAPIVRDIFNLFLLGHSLRDIARALNDSGTPSPRSGAQWSPGSISTILRNHVYVGLRQYGRQRKVRVPYDSRDPRMGTVVTRTRTGEPYVLSEAPVFPPIVDATVFNEVRKQLEARSTRGPKANRNRQPQANIIPLRGRVFCYNRPLEADLTASGKVRFRNRPDRNAGQERVVIYGDVLEATVNSWLSRAFSRRNLPKVIAQLNELSPELQAQQEEIRSRMRDLHQRSSNLLALVERGYEDAIERFEQNKLDYAELEARLEAISRRDINVEQTATVLTALSREMERVLRDASPERLRTLYNRLNVRLDYLPESKSVRITIAGNDTPPRQTTDGKPWGNSRAPGGTRLLPQGDQPLMSAVVPLSA